jgi:3-hydroxyisobutyrate dehydrogenase-like beta-hydroxyacid dehydrogenase
MTAKSTDPMARSASTRSARRAEPAASPVVGVIGLGDMGAAIAAAILKKFPLVAFDIRPAAAEKLVAAGARHALSVAEVSQLSDIIIVLVVDDRQTTEVVGQILANPGRAKHIVISSTVLPATCMTLSEQAKAVGLSLVDAPVSGGAEKASQGIITVLVGGEQVAVATCWPVLQAFGKHLFHLGPIGAGSAGKLITNLLTLGGNMLQLEAMQFAAVHGMTEDAVTAFLPLTTADSRGLRTWGRYDRMRRTHTLAGTPAMYDIFAKDMKVAAKAAGQRGLVLPIVSAVSAMIIEKTQARDAYLKAQGPTEPIPRCRVCTLELAYPFREAGLHPECASGSD